MSRIFVSWNESYSVGNEKIDVQHKKLIDILNSLYESFVEKTTGDALGKVLKQLSDYAHYHFRTEEELFDEYNYPEKEKHVSEHIEFIQKIISFNEEFLVGKTNLTYQLMNYLRNWLINHICGSDQAYAGYIKSIK